MPYNYEIIVDTDLVRETWTGPQTQECMVAAMEQLFADPAWHPRMDVIADFREATFDMTAKQMRDYARWVGPKDSTHTLAIVVARSVDYGMSRMFGMLTDDGRNETTKIFYSMDEAEDWVESRRDAE